MGKKAIHLMLLLSLFLNIAHATVISLTESCDHETVCEYVIELDHGSDCGDLCDMHHMFHLSAIPTATLLVIPGLSISASVDYSPGHYLPPHLEPSYRPPIV
ncbi:hypothetical protein [Hydrogenimonas cancrithermarum]|uniref:Uncharacterized protein n=1 Tax=Hydrogenimonas cancrithermarum TaxID=2993563 RepID=A0ABN6WX50_9BACT|nr:hypothetical protein [Hydrogenimonas cancrithermarum]BDY13722.1 hypothetical protein HCR_20340 [Hydrogenimonas cancrithermarum]